jgi:hypothetical protein
MTRDDWNTICTALLEHVCSIIEFGGINFPFHREPTNQTVIDPDLYRLVNYALVVTALLTDANSDLPLPFILESNDFKRFVDHRRTLVRANPKEYKFRTSVKSVPNEPPEFQHAFYLVIKMTMFLDRLIFMEHSCHVLSTPTISATAEAEIGRPLSESEDKLVQRLFALRDIHKDKNGEELRRISFSPSAIYDNDDLTLYDYCALHPQSVSPRPSGNHLELAGWLSTKIQLAALKLLQHQDMSAYIANHHHRRSLFIDSNTTEGAISPYSESQSRHQIVSCVDLTQMHAIHVLYNLSNTHFFNVLVPLCDRPKHIIIRDSIPNNSVSSKTQQEMTKWLSTFLPVPVDEWIFVRESSCTQPNGKDCGVWAVLQSICSSANVNNAVIQPMRY